MNNLNDVKKKKPFKSYDLKGFSSICISTGGERGICLFLQTTVKQYFIKAFVLVTPQLTPI